LVLEINKKTHQICLKSKPQFVLEDPGTHRGVQPTTTSTFSAALSKNLGKGLYSPLKRIRCHPLSDLEMKGEVSVVTIHTSFLEEGEYVVFTS
jgi:hypothetical protein